MSILHIKLDQLTGRFITSIDVGDVPLEGMKIKEKEVRILFRSHYRCRIQSYMGEEPCERLAFLYGCIWSVSMVFSPNGPIKIIVLLLSIPLFISIALYQDALRYNKTFFNSALPSLVDKWASTNDYSYEYSRLVYDESSRLIDQTVEYYVSAGQRRRMHDLSVNTIKRSMYYILL